MVNQIALILVPKREGGDVLSVVGSYGGQSLFCSTWEKSAFEIVLLPYVERCFRPLSVFALQELAAMREGYREMKRLASRYLEEMDQVKQEQTQKLKQKEADLMQKCMQMDEVHSERAAEIRQTKELQSECHSERNAREVHAAEAEKLREELNAALASETFQHDEAVRANRRAEAAAHGEAEMESKLQQLHSEHAQVGVQDGFRGSKLLAHEILSCFTMMNSEGVLARLEGQLCCLFVCHLVCKAWSTNDIRSCHFAVQPPFLLPLKTRSLFDLSKFSGGLCIRGWSTDVLGELKRTFLSHDDQLRLRMPGGERSLERIQREKGRDGHEGESWTTHEPGALEDWTSEGWGHSRFGCQAIPLTVGVADLEATHNSPFWSRIGWRKLTGATSSEGLMTCKAHSLWLHF